MRRDFSVDNMALVTATAEMLARRIATLTGQSPECILNSAYAQTQQNARYPHKHIARGPKMIAPTTMMIGIALDSISTLSPFIRESQIKEFHAVSEERLLAIGITERTPEVIAAYELGVQAARTLIAGLPAALAADVTF